MPFINTKVNFPLTKEETNVLKDKYGRAMSLMGKPEAYTMLVFEDNSNMYFAGKDDAKMSMVEIKVFGKANGTDAMTAEITKILNETLGIDPMMIYVKYEECNMWGMGGSNF